VYDYYIEIKENNINQLYLISKQFEDRENLYHVNLWKMKTGKYNMLLPVNNLFTFNEELEYPLTNPRDLRYPFNVSMIDRARGYYHLMI
jgi:hypothetical protein